MNLNKLTLSSSAYPQILNKLPMKPPEVLYHRGAPLNELLKRPAVAIVGSRRMSIYGRQVTTELARNLAEQGVVIVSGLALGVDCTAHQAALEVGGLCIGVLPCPIDKIVPADNQRLADKILKNGGALVSEYAPGEPPFKQNFIARNRIMSGLAQAVLITEAAAKSGTLYTATFAKDQGRDVLVVPGDINKPNYAGANNLIKSGAGLVTSYLDVLHALKLEPHKTAAKAVRGRNAHEQKILDLILEGITDGDQLLETSGLHIDRFNQALTMLEIAGKVRPLGMNHWAIS